MKIEGTMDGTGRDLDEEVLLPPEMAVGQKSYDELKDEERRR